MHGLGIGASLDSLALNIRCGAAGGGGGASCAGGSAADGPHRFRLVTGE